MSDMANAVTIQACLYQMKSLLSSLTDVPKLEAEILLAHLLKKPRSFLHAWPETLLSEEDEHKVALLLSRRLNHEPIAYITGSQAFWSLDLLVNQHTLIPRPETELLVKAVLTQISEKKTGKNVADLGTGSGAIALALKTECPFLNVFATDMSEDALLIAKQNAARLSCDISFHHGNWCAALPTRDFHCIVSNPPYIAITEWELYAKGLAFEPPQALLSGRDGLDAIREIIETAKHYLKHGGYLLIEHGFSQGEAVRALCHANNYSNISSLRDFSDHERVTIACWMNS